MIERIKKWNLYILKNHPAIWMSGLHIIIPVLIPILIFGYSFGYFMSNSNSVNGFVGLTLAVICLVAIIVWQFFRFKKEVTFSQLVKFYICCSIIYFIASAASSGPLIGAIEKNKVLIPIKENLESNLKIYIFAKGLKHFYVEDSCYFETWNNTDLKLFNWGGKDTIPSDSCTKSSISFNKFFVRINEAIHYLNLDDPIGLREELRDSDDDGVLDFYDLCVDDSGMIDNYGCPKKVNADVLELIKKMRTRRESVLTDYEPYFIKEFQQGQILLTRAVKLIISDSIDVFYDNNIKTIDNIIPYNLERDINRLLIINENYDFRNKSYVSDDFSYLNRSNSNIDYNDLLIMTLLLFIIVSVLSSLILTARFIIETMFSIVVAIIMGSIFSEFIVSFLKDDKLLEVFIIPTIIIILYWILINNKFKATTWKRTLLLHITNLYLIVNLFVIGKFQSNDYDKINLVNNSILFSVIVLILNLFFLYQYHRHLRLPKKSN